MELAFSIGLLAGAIFFIDAWGPSKEGTTFLESRRFRGLSIIITGGIITPVVDKLRGNSQLPFFLDYLKGCVMGWFLLFILGLLLYAIWVLTKNAKKPWKERTGEYAFTVLDFIYLGISDNPHLNNERDAKIEVAKVHNVASLRIIQAQLENQDTTPRGLDKNRDAQISVSEYVESLISSKFEKYYNFYDWYYKAVVEYNRGEYERTITYIKNALEKEAKWEDKAEALLYMALSYDELHMTEEAIKYYDRIINEYPDYSNLYLIWYDKGTNLYERSMYKKAAHAFEQGILLNAEDGDLNYNMGLNYEALKDHSKALSCYEKTLQKSPDDPDAWRRKGEMLQELDRYDDALIAFNEAIKRHEDEDVWFSKGEVLQELKRYDDAIDAYKKTLTFDAHDTNTLFNLATVLQNKKDYTGALDYLNRVLDITPDDVDSLYQRASIYDDMEKYPEALADFEACIAIKPDDADIWFDKAVTLEKMEEPEKSLKAFQKSISLNKSDPVTWFRKGSLLESIGKQEEALKAYEKAIEINPNYFEACYNIATLQAFRKEYPKALESYKHVIQINPKNADTWFSLGTVYENIKEYDKALEAYNKSLSLNEAEAEAWYNKSVVLKKLGRDDESNKSLEKATSIDPDILSKNKTE